MTPVQQRALRFIALFMETRSRSPSFQEIADGLGLKSRGAVHRILGHLEFEGLVTRAPARPYSIQLTAKALQGDCTLIALPADLQARLERQAATEGASPAVVARRAIAEYLDGRAG